MDFSIVNLLFQGVMHTCIWRLQNLILLNIVQWTQHRQETFSWDLNFLSLIIIGCEILQDVTCHIHPSHLCDCILVISPITSILRTQSHNTEPCFPKTVMSSVLAFDTYKKYLGCSLRNSRDMVEYLSSKEATIFCNGNEGKICTLTILYLQFTKYRSSLVWEPIRIQGCWSEQVDHKGEIAWTQQ